MGHFDKILRVFHFFYIIQKIKSRGVKISRDFFYAALLKKWKEKHFVV